MMHIGRSTREVLLLALLAAATATMSVVFAKHFFARFFVFVPISE
jgi:hypothetical protein